MKKKKTASAEVCGLYELFKQTCADRPKHDLIGMAMKAVAEREEEKEKREEAQSIAIEQHEALRKHNLKGALARASNYEPKKEIVRQVYDALVAQVGKPPNPNVLHRAVLENHPELKNELSDHTIRKWVMKLNKGEAI